MPFQSLQPDILLPRHLTTWEWLYEDPVSSPIHRYPEDELAGFENGITKERLNWREVKEAATCLSTALVRKCGLKEDDTVALFSPNTIWYPVAMHATLRVGGKISGASPAYNVEEMTYALRTAEAKFIFTHPASMEVALAASKNVGISKDRLFLLEGRLDGYETIKELIDMGRRESQQVPHFTIPKGKTNFDVCGFLSFSSGTTGLPKAVMIAHQNIIAQCLQIQQITPKTLTSVLAVLPAFHITGLVHTLHLPLVVNASVIMLPAFDMKTMLDTMVAYQMREILLVPPILLRMVRDPIVDRYDLGAFLERFSSGAAPLSEEVIQLLQKRFPSTTTAVQGGMKQGYGMTESCSCITAHTPAIYDWRHAHTVGRVVASTTIKIVRDDGSETAVDEPGEIWAKGPQIVIGYLNNPRATADTFDRDGYLHTGDQGKIDAHGLVTILDRIKEMIKVKGIGVAPAELEDLLLGHDKVEDVAVMGIPDDYNGEVPKAFVVPKAGVAGDHHLGMELMRYVRERKIRYKSVREVEFIDAVPKSASGKILRRVLKDRAKENQHGLVVKEEKARM